MEPIINFDRLEYVFLIDAENAPVVDLPDAPAARERRKRRRQDRNPRPRTVLPVGANAGSVRPMNRDVRTTVFTIIALAVCILLQSTILNRIAIRGVRPDLALIVLIFVSMRRGSMVGQVSGFAAGLFEDLMNVSPLGFHSLMRTVIGYLYGIFAGNVFIDPFLMPMVLTVIATILKGLLAGIISAIFGSGLLGIHHVHGEALDRGGLQRRARAVPLCASQPLSHLQAGGQGRGLMEYARAAAEAALRLSDRPFAGSIGFLVLYLFWLQIVKGFEFKQRARDVSQRELPIPAQRGEIFDSNADDPLVFNVDSFAVDVSPGRGGPGRACPRFSSACRKVLSIPVADIEKKIPAEALPHVPAGGDRRAASPCRPFPTSRSTSRTSPG